MSQPQPSQPSSTTPQRPSPSPIAGHSASQTSPSGSSPAPRQPSPPEYVQGPLIMQPASAARLGHILVHSAEELWDAAALEDPAWMWEEARAIASRILASCPLDPLQTTSSTSPLHHS